MIQMLLAAAILALGVAICMAALRKGKERTEEDAAEPARIPVRPARRPHRDDRRS